MADPAVGGDTAHSPCLLAIETSGTMGSVALVTPERSLAELIVEASQSHAQQLLPAIDRLLRETDTGWQRIDAIAVSLGPGSFTGLRIGLSTAKGLSLAAGKPLIGVPSLDGLASQGKGQGLPVCALVDARKKEVYAAFYRENEAGEMVRQSDYLALTPVALAERITEPAFLLGSGAELYRDLLAEQLGAKARFADPARFFARAASVGQLAIAKFQNQDFLAPTAGPLYVRASDAELQLGMPRI
ncbi:MAG: tRNA (adenosine(37)-N6)-threonylcarbamoyltransferase complex dimerization subunit type 1 TsaB [Thermodesulfobacteriota bacterium]